jgi:hypothetical protein
MPHFWSTDASGRWGILPLPSEGCAVALDGNVLRPLNPTGGPCPETTRVLIVPFGSAPHSPSWSLLAAHAASLFVNGRVLLLGLRVLRDKDAICIAGRHLYFSAEELAKVAPFPGLAQPACCPRCKQKLEVGDAAVSCPSCHAWHHQSERFPCWTYDSTCAFCQSQPTALDAGYSWTPEQL